MRKFSTLTILMLCATFLFAQAPEKFTYQSVVRNANNSLVINAPVGVRVSILQGGVNGTLVYMETQTAVTNANGLVTLQIGGGNVQQGVFANIDWANGLYFLKTETDPNGGSDYSVTSTQQLLSVPYALYAKDAGNRFSGDYNDLTNLPQIPQNVSELTNDAGYITMDSVPTIPTNISAFTNDAGYLTDYTETDPQYNAWNKDYNDLINKPTIPTVPSNVSAFTNDAGYITEVQLNLLLAALNSTIDSLRDRIGDLEGNSPIQQVALPTVTTMSVTNVTVTTAQCGGYISSDGGDSIIERGVCWGVSAHPTTAGSHTSEGTGVGSFVSNLYNLQSGTTYYVRAYATNSVGTSYGAEETFCTFETNYQDGQPCPGTPTVTDHEGNVYHTVMIGNQCWTKENLRTTTSPRTGTYLISAAGGYTYTGKQACWYYSDSTTYSSMNYGLLYNWNAAVDTFNTAYTETNVNDDYNKAVWVNFTGHRQGICPVGWHLPSDAEWTQLTDYVSSQSHYVCGSNNTYIAKALSNSTRWNTSLVTCGVGNGLAANNATGFSALPAGFYDGSCNSVGNGSYFWSATQSYGYIVYNRALGNNSADVYRGGQNKSYGYSVRCLRDDNGGGTSSATLSAVTTGAVSNVTTTTATCGGTVTSDGGATVTARGVCWSTSPNPTVSGNHTTDGSGTGAFTSSITGLTTNITYYVRAYATTSVGTSYGVMVTFTTPVIDEKSCPTTPTVTDHEGNVYATVQIGSQCWMRDNLRTTTSPSTGTYLIPAVNVGITYTGKQARWYNDDSTRYAPMNYGLLYNWNAAVDTFNTVYGETVLNAQSVNAVSVNFTGNRRGICPAGWHLPSNAEWTQFSDYVSGQIEYRCDSVTNNIAKSLASPMGWDTSNNSCAVGNGLAVNNATRFSVLPAGRHGLGFANSYAYAGEYTTFWSATQNGGYYANTRYLYYDNAYMNIGGTSKYAGFSVRCLRD